jgi:glucokinase
MKLAHVTRQAIGIDFGGTTIKCAVVAGGRILRRGSVIETAQYASSDALIDALIAEVRDLADESVEAIGIGMPGFVDSINGVVHALSNVPGWRNVPLGRLLYAATGLTCWIDNDANAMAYGEWRYGAGRDQQHVVFVTLGTGVGGGLVLDGRLYRGAQLGAGEVGQMSVDLNGNPGAYGNFGALDKLVGNKEIAALAEKYYAEAGEARDSSDFTPKALSEAARAGDAVAQRVWQEIGELIGAGLSNVIWLLNPGAIVIGGGVAKAGKVLFDPICAAIEARTSPVFHEQLEVLPAELGSDAGIIGCAALALDQTPHGWHTHED